MRAAVLVAAAVVAVSGLLTGARFSAADAQERASDRIKAGPLYLYDGDFWTYVNPTSGCDGSAPPNFSPPTSECEVSRGGVRGPAGAVNFHALFERPREQGEPAQNCYGDVVYDRGFWSFDNDCGVVDPGFDYRYGTQGDMPLVGNWDGHHSSDETAEGWGTSAVVRVVNGRLRWFIENDMPSDGVADIVFDYGSAGDIPVVGTWLETEQAPFPGLDKPAIIRASGGTWHFYLSTDPITATDGRGDVHFTIGSVHRGDKPYIGKVNRCCQDFAGVVRGNRWFVDIQTDALSRTTSDGKASRSFTWGEPAGRDDLVGVYERPIGGG